MFDKGLARLLALYRRRDSTAAGQLHRERVACEDAVRRMAECEQQDHALEQDITALWSGGGASLTQAGLFDRKRLESRLISQRLTLGIDRDNAMLRREELEQTIEQLRAQRRYYERRLRKLDYLAIRMREQRCRITQAHAARAQQEVIDAKAFDGARRPDDGPV